MKTIHSPYYTSQFNNPFLSKFRAGQGGGGQKESEWTALVEEAPLCRQLFSGAGLQEGETILQVARHGPNTFEGQRRVQYFSGN